MDVHSSQVAACQLAKSEKSGCSRNYLFDISFKIISNFGDLVLDTVRSFLKSRCARKCRDSESSLNDQSALSCQTPFIFSHPIVLPVFCHLCYYYYLYSLGIVLPLYHTN